MRLGVEYNQICKVVDNNGRFNSGRVQDLLNKARMGWWEADFSKNSMSVLIFFENC